ncbi:hypothetical protein E1B28_001516 [Marasmius oreades]|uniref:2,5-diamino-6-ribosylamino-4(3H)-pyrimidinone 5'-phosphate reductase n=1 Tax=Marasmius oreades TaxID=181124 RepID=A0A9P7V3Q8_9AGAR|nr:uncharacterized protein E1B28_001516 [Marasmius oreades]KAG7099694.1 hypothetical protein E1B28_001516 [Marasmius oreades]
MALQQQQPPPPFLRSILNKYHIDDLSDLRPHVTLTFAQSIDAKIAGVKGKQLILSGKESMIMTHWMRTMHDAILVGIGTALNDNPQLNSEFSTKEPDPSKNGHDRPYSLPRPIVLDSHLRLDPACKLLINFQSGLGRRPWILCSEPDEFEERKLWETRRSALVNAGAIVLLAPSQNKDTLNVSACLSLLRERGIRSLMVEGGARVIKSFFAEEYSPSLPSNSKGIIDTIIVTVSPAFVGDAGGGYNVDVEEDTRFVHDSTEVFGRDTVIAFSRANESVDFHST